MSPDDRRALLVEYLVEMGHGSVTQLAEVTQVSPMTVRRDLDLLEKDGLISRMHGGAVAAGSSVEPQFEDRAGSKLAEKRAIARTVIDMIPENALVFLDAGTTTREIARMTVGRTDLTIVTGSLRAIEVLATDNAPVVCCTGGRLKQEEQALVGPAATRYVSERFADVALISAAGLSLDGRVSDFDEDEVALKRAMIASSQRTCLCLDSSKIGRRTRIAIGGVGDFDDLVTTSKSIPKELADRMARSSVAVHYAPPSTTHWKGAIQPKGTAH